VLVGKIVTPTVLKMVRSYFGCETMTGAELENQPTSSTDCFGSHWEERIYNTVLGVMERRWWGGWVGGWGAFLWAVGGGGVGGGGGGGGGGPPVEGCGVGEGE
jgi:hypothetical protein